METPESGYKRLQLRVSSLVQQLNMAFRPSVQALVEKATAAQAEQDEIMVRLADAEAQLETVVAAEAKKRIRGPQDALDALPGFRHPKWYTVRLDFEAGQTTPEVKLLTLLPKGPFVLTSISGLYEVTQTGTDATGRYIPLSGMRFSSTQGGSLAAVSGINSQSARFNLYQTEFDFAIEIVGATRRWSNNNIASFVIDPTARNNRPGIIGWIDPMDKIRVTVAPAVRSPPPLGGRVVFVFAGLEVVNAIRLAELIRRL